MTTDANKVLYVEDEPLLGKIIKESLESRGFAVTLVQDGAEVMATYAAFQPDICVFDVMLPHRDGFSLGQEVRQLAPRMPILFLTAKTQTQDILQGFQSGGNDYLKKPFSIEELIARMENLLRMMSGDAPASKTASDELSFGQFSYHLSRYELKHPSQTRSLSHREAQLLHLLLQHQNQVLPRKKILLDLWGDDSFFNSRNLDVYIARLRDYLKLDPQVRIITLKGVGYRFAVM